MSRVRSIVASLALASTGFAIPRFAIPRFAIPRFAITGIALMGFAIGCGAPRERESSLTSRANAPAPLPPLPSAAQLAWHERPYYAFVHFGMNTFTEREWGEGREDPSTFAPSELDCRQWARTFKDAGMRGVILTAKHHDGFCLWPSRTTEHTLAHSRWRDGRGDVLRELSDACREFGLDFGVYLSPWDRNHPAYGDSERYNAVFREQLREVLSNYGPIFEVWFDGACGEGPNGKKQVYDWPSFVAVVRELQPNAVIFSDAGPDVRWVGNERGEASETSWVMLKRDEFFPGTPRFAELGEGHAEGTHWVPPECDVSIRKGWYWRASEDDTVKGLDELEHLWLASVGRNANFLLNVPADARGQIPEREASVLRALRERLDATYGVDLARDAVASASNARSGPWDSARATDGDPASAWGSDDGVVQAQLTLRWRRPVELDRVVLEEALELGQRVRAFRVDVEDESGVRRELARGTTIGARRILATERVRASALHVVVLDGRASPVLRRVGVHATPVVR